MTLALYGKTRKRQGGLLLAALLAVFAAVLLGLTLTQQQNAQAATTTEGPLAGTSNGNYTDWNRSDDDENTYEHVDDACGSGDGLYLSASDDGVRFSVNIPLTATNNGKRISKVDIVPCFRKDSNGSGGNDGTFATFARIDGTNYDGPEQSVGNLTTCTASAAQAITIPGNVLKSGSTDLEVGAVKTDTDGSGVRICAITAKVYFEDVVQVAPKLTIVKETESFSHDHTVTSTADFNFSVTRGEAPQPATTAASLDDDGTNGNPLSKSITIDLPLVTGANDTYTIAETNFNMPGWLNWEVICEGSSPNKTETGGAFGGDITITVENNDDITCTFYNKKPSSGTLIVHKVGIDIPGGSPAANGTITPSANGDGTWTAPMAGGTETLEAPNGTYQVAETGMPVNVTGGQIVFVGFKETTSTTACSTNAAEYTNNGEVTVNNNTQVVCVMNKFVPSPTGKIVVKKVVDTSPGVPAADGSLFSGTISGDTGADPDWGPMNFGGNSGELTVPAGVQTVTETGTSGGWTPVGWKIYSNVASSSAQACSTTKADYTTLAGSSVNATVVAGQITQVCVMNTKDPLVVTPGITKVKHADGMTPGGFAYWTIAINNTGSTVAQNVYITDDNATYVSVESGGSCGLDTDFGDGDGINCSVNAAQTLKVKVSKPAPAQTCDPQSVNNAASAWVGVDDEGTLIDGVGGGEDTKYNIPAKDPKHCTTVKKISTGNDNGTWEITFTNDGEAAVLVNFSDTYQDAFPGDAATDTDIVSITRKLTGEPVEGCDPPAVFPNGTDTVIGCEVSVPANSTVTIIVTTEVPAAQCKGFTVSNTVNAYFGSGSPQGDGVPVKEQGDNTAVKVIDGDPSLCTRVITFEKEYFTQGTVDSGDVPTFVLSPDPWDVTDPIGDYTVVDDANCTPDGDPLGSSWTCTVPAAWNGEVEEIVPEGWEQVDCTTKLEGVYALVQEIFSIVEPLQVPAHWDFCNQPENTLEIIKVFPDGYATNATVFEGSLDSVDTSLSFDWDDETGSAGGHVINNIPSGGYTLHEDDEDGYEFVGVGLTAEEACNPRTDEALKIADVLLTGGVNETLYVCNRPFADVTVIKQHVGDFTGFNWTFGEDLPGAFNAVPGGVDTSVTAYPKTSVTPGNYGVNENQGLTQAEGCFGDTAPGYFTQFTIQKNGAAAGTPTEVGGSTVNIDVVAGDSVVVTFYNVRCELAASPIVIIQKFNDRDGDRTGTTPLGGFEFRVRLDGVDLDADGNGGNGIQNFFTDENGLIVIPGIDPALVEVDEVIPEGWHFTGSTTDMGDNGSLEANTSGQPAAVEVTFDDVLKFNFYNRQLGEILVDKTTRERINGSVPTNTPNDDDGWAITVSSEDCNYEETKDTDNDGEALFDNLPLCDDYVVSEDPNSGPAGYEPVNGTQRFNIAPGQDGPTLVEFLNEKDEFVPCCSVTIPTPTPTNTPTNTPTATNTPAPGTPTNTPTATPTTPVSGQQGERTPGPGSTPIAPSAGDGLMGGATGGINLILVIGGLIALASGISFVAMGRKNRA